MNQITQTQLDWLYDYLDSDEHDEDVLEFYGYHGLLTACAIIPVTPGWEEIHSWIFDQPVNSSTETEQLRQFKQLTLLLIDTIQDEITAEEQVSLPFDITPRNISEEMESWCSGFMQAIFDTGEQLESLDQEALSTLLLPFELGSRLFEQESEFQQIMKKPKLMEQILNQIPETLVDLYLLTHSA